MRAHEAKASMMAAAFNGRVLYVARAPFISGAERALISIFRGLDRTRVEPLLVLGQSGPMVDHARKYGVDSVIVPLPKREPKGLWAWWRSLRELRRVVREFNPDVIHANDVPSCQAMSVVGRKLRVPRVVHVRWGITASEMAWWARDGAEGVVCISKWVREQMGDPAGTPFGDAKIEIIHDAADWAGEEVGDGNAEAERLAASGTEETRAATPGVGFAGQLIESKGLDVVIEALALMPAARRPLLRVAGEDTQTGGEYKRYLQDLAQQRGVGASIEWLGFVEDVGAMYRTVRAVVCPSRMEPLGLIPLEAARWRVPAIASPVGGFPETIDDGRTGWLAEPTPQGWAAALERVHDVALCARMGAAAHERVKSEFSPQAYQTRLMQLYSLLAGRADEARGRKG